MPRVDNPGKSTNGTYTGNGAANRAVAHGLGKIPRVVFLYASGSAALWFISDQLAQIVYTANAAYAVTAMTASDFYVGNVASMGGSANDAGVVYYWEAIP